MKTDYKCFIDNIKSTDKIIEKKAWDKIDGLAKPPGSLGEIEEIAIKLCSISNSLLPDISKRCVIVLAADNGVVEEGIASAPQDLTATHSVNIANYITGVGVFAKQFSTDILVADVGINEDFTYNGIINKKIRKSTGNIAKENAMSKEEVEQAVQTGIDLALDAKDKGYKLIGVGEMGIGNTTTSSAVLAGLLGIHDGLESLVGRGAGLSDYGYAKKIEVVKNAIDKNKPNTEDPIDIIQKVGGLDIAAMTGVYIGAAYAELPVVIDGFISIVAALCAYRLNKKVKDYMFASHRSFERGYALAEQELGLTPVLNLNMRLGEGSGCPLMFAVMDASVAVLKNMASFQQAQIGDEYLNNISDIKNKAF